MSDSVPLRCFSRSDGDYCLILDFNFGRYRIIENDGSHWSQRMFRSLEDAMAVFDAKAEVDNG